MLSNKEQVPADWYNLCIFPSVQEHVLVIVLGCSNEDQFLVLMCWFSFSYHLTLVDSLDTLLVSITKFHLFLTKKCNHLNQKLCQNFFFSNDVVLTLKWILFLQIMGNETEFLRVANLLKEEISFDKDINVSVFETNIRGI